MHLDVQVERALRDLAYVPRVQVVRLRRRVPLAHEFAGDHQAEARPPRDRRRDLARVRIGVGKPASKEHGADHVLRRPPKRDRLELDVSVNEAADAVELIVSEGVDAAMNRVNTRTP